MVVRQQGEIAEACRDAMDGIIDDMANCGNFLTTDRMLVENWVKNNGELTIASYIYGGET